MNLTEAERLAAYCLSQCWWLDVRTARLAGVDASWSVVLRLYWPKEPAIALTEYRTEPADAAIERLCDISDEYWKEVAHTVKQAS